MHLSQCFPAVTTSLSLFIYFYFKFLSSRPFSPHPHTRSSSIPYLSHSFLSSLPPSLSSLPFLAPSFSPLPPLSFPSLPSRALYNILPKATSVDLTQCCPRTCRTVALTGDRPLTEVSKRYVRSCDRTALPCLHWCSTPHPLSLLSSCHVLSILSSCLLLSILSSCLLHFFIYSLTVISPFIKPTTKSRNLTPAQTPTLKPDPNLGLNYALLSTRALIITSSSTTLPFRFPNTISWNRSPRKSPHSLTWDFLKSSPRQH